MLTFTLLLILAQAPDAGSVRGDSPATRKRLADAEQQLSTEPAKARAALLKIIDDAGDELVATQGGMHQPARRVAQSLLAKLPKDEYESLRAALEPAAKKRLEAAGRDERQLRELVERYRHTASAAVAVERLGDLAFERGDFAKAEALWRRLLPAATEAEQPVIPEATEHTRLQAQVVLAAIQQGERPRALELIKAFEASAPNATGTLAGENGNLFAILIRRYEANVPSPSAIAQDSDWSTLGGDAARRGEVPGSLIATTASPTWAAPLPVDDSAQPTPINTTRLVAYHGAFIKGWLLVAQPHRITSFDTDSGAVRIVHESKSSREARPWRDADFTLTVAGNRVYARMGPAGVLPTDAVNGTESKLIALTTDDPDAPPSRIAWSVKPPVAADIVAGWEGAPTVVGNRVYAAYSRRDGGRIVNAIACYDGLATEPLWTVDVAESAATERRERHLLLTHTDGIVVLATHAGVIAAVDAATGKPAWAFHYQSITLPRQSNRHRDLSPPLARDGRVIVAPNDSDHVFAFDSTSGRLLWKSGPIIVDHLIGATDHCAIAAVTAPQRGLRGFDVRTGTSDAHRGWCNHDDVTLASHGRGLIAGDHVAWPTAYGLHFLRATDGLPARQSLPGPQGNVVFAVGRLAVITPREVRFYRVPLQAPPRSAKPAIFAKTLTLPAMIAASTAPLTLTSSPTMVPSDSKLPITAPEFDIIQKLTHGGAIVRIDDRHIARVDTSGKPLWIRNATLKDGYHSESLSTSPRFDRPIFADERYVIARTSRGNVAVFETKIGDVLERRKTESQSWTAPPVKIGGGYAFADGSETITAFDASRRIVWKHSSERPASVTGAAPEVAIFEEAVFTLVRRNHGDELQRLRINNFDVSVEREWLLPEVGGSLSQAVRVTNALFIPGKSTLIRITLNDEKLATTPWPASGHWKLHAATNAVIAVPLGFSARPAPSAAALLRNSAFQLIAAETALDAPSVLVIDSSTGEIKHRLITPGPLVASRITSQGLEIATSSHWHRIK